MLFRSKINEPIRNGNGNANEIELNKEKNKNKLKIDPPQFDLLKSPGSQRRATFRTVLAKQNTNIGYNLFKEFQIKEMSSEISSPRSGSNTKSVLNNFNEPMTERNKNLKFGSDIKIGIKSCGTKDTPRNFLQAFTNNYKQFRNFVFKAPTNAHRSTRSEDFDSTKTFSKIGVGIKDYPCNKVLEKYMSNKIKEKEFPFINHKPNKKYNSKNILKVPNVCTSRNYGASNVMRVYTSKNSSMFLNTLNINLPRRKLCKKKSRKT